MHVKASIHRALGQAEEALAAYRRSLDREPLQLAWRYELAELLYEQEQFQESFQELLKVQMLQPEDEQVRGLMDAVKGRSPRGGSKDLAPRRSVHPGAAEDNFRRHVRA